MPDITPYAWVLLAFSLVAVLVWWVKKTPRQVSKTEQEQRAAQREARLLNLYQNLEDLMDSFEDYVHQQEKQLDQRKQQLDEAMQAAGQAAEQAQNAAGQAAQAALQADTVANAALAQAMAAKQTAQQQPLLQEQAGEPTLTLLRTKPAAAPLTPGAQAAQLQRQGLDEAQIAKRMGIARSGVKMLLQMQQQDRHHVI